MMTLEELNAIFSQHCHLEIQLMLPDGAFVPAHFHVTEVGRVQKEFIDCGGAIRKAESCVLQVWVANDTAHRLDTTRLAAIISRGLRLFETTAIPLEIEYDNGVISQYPVQKAELSSAGLTLHLGNKHTACLAPDHCGVELNVVSSCSTPGCC